MTAIRGMHMNALIGVMSSERRGAFDRIAGPAPSSARMWGGHGWRVGPWHVLCCDAATAAGAAIRREASGVSATRLLAMTFRERIKAPRLAQLVHRAQPLWQ